MDLLEKNWLLLLMIRPPEKRRMQALICTRFWSTSGSRSLYLEARFIVSWHWKRSKDGTSLKGKINHTRVEHSRYVARKSIRSYSPSSPPSWCWYRTCPDWRCTCTRSVSAERAVPRAACSRCSYTWFCSNRFWSAAFRCLSYKLSMSLSPVSTTQSKLTFIAEIDSAHLELVHHTLHGLTQLLRCQRVIIQTNQHGFGKLFVAQQLLGDRLLKTFGEQEKNEEAKLKIEVCHFF